MNPGPRAHLHRLVRAPSRVASDRTKTSRAPGWLLAGPVSHSHTCAAVEQGVASATESQAALKFVFGELRRPRGGMVVDAQRKPNKLTLREFLAREDAPQIKLGAHFNGGAFMDCHCRVFAETGIWIEELVPVFQKLDAHLAVANEKTVRALSPTLA